MADPEDDQEFSNHLHWLDDSYQIEFPKELSNEVQKDPECSYPVRPQGDEKQEIISLILVDTQFAQIAEFIHKMADKNLNRLMEGRYPLPSPEEDQKYEEYLDDVETPLPGEWTKKERKRFEELSSSFYLLNPLSRRSLQSLNELFFKYKAYWDPFLLKPDDMRPVLGVIGAFFCDGEHWELAAFKEDPEKLKIAVEQFNLTSVEKCLLNLYLSRINTSLLRRSRRSLNWYEFPRTWIKKNPDSYPGVFAFVRDLRDNAENNVTVAAVTCGAVTCGAYTLVRLISLDIAVTWAASVLSCLVFSWNILQLNRASKALEEFPLVSELQDQVDEQKEKLSKIQREWRDRLRTEDGNDLWDEIEEISTQLNTILLKALDAIEFIDTELSKLSKRGFVSTAGGLTGALGCAIFGHPIVAGVLLVATTGNLMFTIHKSSKFKGEKEAYKQLEQVCREEIKKLEALKKEINTLRVGKIIETFRIYTKVGAIEKFDKLLMMQRCA